jgi:hypothetical protein
MNAYIMATYSTSTSRTNEIKIIGDGTCPPSLAGKIKTGRVCRTWYPNGRRSRWYFCKLMCKSGEGIIAHLGRRNGEFEMVAAKCSVFEPPADELTTRLEECGIPFWPHAFIKVKGDVQQLVKSWKNEYAVLGYGEYLYEDLLAFCELTNIRVIAV